MTIEDKPENSDAMQQTNQGNAKGWQTEVKGGTANIAETIIQVSLADAAGITWSDKDINFQPYLQALIANEKYQQKWGFYTPTDAVGKLKEPKAASELDLGLMVQLLQPQRLEDAPNPERQEKTERLPVLEGIRKYAADHVLLMGRPGSGKSTALLRLLVDEAKKALADASAPVPVLVELRYLEAERPSVLERIGAFLRSHDLNLEETTFTTALAAGRFLLLVDGVNELPSEAARRAVARFRQDYPKTPMVFTTRDVAIGGDVGIEKKLEMQPLSESQMRQFVKAYLPQQGEPMLRQLQGRLREVGQTPLLLWMLCEVFKGLEQLPSSLGLLFRWFVGEYDRLKQDAPVSPGLHHWQSEMLQHLAFTMMQAEEPTELRVAISRSEAEGVLAEFLQGKVEYPTQRAKEWLEDLLEHHLLQRTSQNQLEFHHQLIQEYYAAEALLHRLPQLSDEQLKRDYLNYLKWTEAIALSIALIEQKAQAIQVIRLALETDLSLGAKLAGSGKPELIQDLIDLINHLEIPERLRIKLLGITRSDNVISILSQFLNDQEFSSKWVVVQALEEVGSKVSGNILCDVIRHNEIIRSDISLCELMIDAIGKILDRDASKFLQQTIENDTNKYIRAFAVKLLGKIGDENVISFLGKAARDEDGYVREKAFGELRKIGSEAAITEVENSEKLLFGEFYSLLSDSVKSGQLIFEKVVRAELKKQRFDHSTWTWKKSLERELGFSVREDDLVELLKQLVKHRSSEVRLTAIRVLGEVGDKDSVVLLCEALSDSNFDNRANAAFELGKIGDEDSIPKLIEAFHEEMGFAEDDFYVRLSILESLGEIGSKQAIPLLLKVINSQSNDLFRAAVQAIMKIDSPEALKVLVNIQTSTESDNSVILTDAIATIQNRCKYYNHEIAHDLIPKGQAIALFFSYASKDEALQHELAKHLNLLERQGVITRWDSRQILPGDEWEQVISQQLNTADIILLLISPDAIAEDTCYDLETRRAMERHQAGEARVIPILLRPVDWTSAPFSQLDVLPKNKQPVTTWANRDEAFREIAEGIRAVAIELRRLKKHGE